jgi:hypothetical protein
MKKDTVMFYFAIYGHESLRPLIPLLTFELQTNSPRL